MLFVTRQRASSLLVACGCCVFLRSWLFAGPVTVLLGRLDAFREEGLFVCLLCVAADFPHLASGGLLLFAKKVFPLGF